MHLQWWQLVVAAANIILLCHGQLFARKDNNAINTVLEVSLPSEVEEWGTAAGGILHQEQEGVEELVSDHTRHKRDVHHHPGHPYKSQVWIQ